QLERTADCSVFQTFDWLLTWHRHMGRPNGEQPAIIVGRRDDGALFLMPLAVVPGAVRRLSFLGSDFCDYNAPILASNFSDHVAPESFLRLWLKIRVLVMSRYPYDLIELAKMPERVGGQRNPLLSLEVGLNPSGAHATEL